MKEHSPLLMIENSFFGYKAGSEVSVLLKNVSVKADRGELIAIIGKNGSGKTTLLNSILKIIPLIHGSIVLNGRDINTVSPSEMAKTVGFVSTFMADYGELRVDELVRLGRYPYTNMFGILTDNDREKISHALDLCGIEFLKRRKFSTLSDGEKQRSMLARLFAQDTEIMLLDEPTSFLDIPNKFDIFSLLKDLSHSGKSLIFTTHDLRLASLYADKLWVIHDGNLVEGAPEDLYLSNELRDIFSNEGIVMDKQTGEFKPVKNTQALVITDAEPDCDYARVWTSKALEKKGIIETTRDNLNKEPKISVHILKEKNKFVWKVSYLNKEFTCFSIYELINIMQNLINHDIS